MPAPPPGLDQTALAKTLVSGEQARPQRLARGTAVGRYLVLELLGEGGMGTVYSAYDPELDRKVALKLLKLGGEDPEVARARLQREAQAMARLSHPNVLSVFDVGLCGGELFLAMELAEGATLRTWLSARPRSRREILKVLSAAGEGLAAAHAAGLVHRDFKPENVLVDRDGGRVRVTDFGLAHVEQRAEPPPAGTPTPAPLGGSGATTRTAAGAIVGTPAYMSPEQHLGAPTDPRTDQFSFCVALWEALCGARPFAGLDLPTLRHAVLVAPPPAPPRALPFFLRRALARGLSRRAEDRFPSMDGLLLALRRDPVARARRLAAVALAAAATVGAGGLLGWRWWQEETRCEREAERVRSEHWQPARQEQLRAALARTGVRPADRDWALGEVDGALRRWARTSRQTCEARRRGEQVPVEMLSCVEGFPSRVRYVLDLLCDPATRARGTLEAALLQLGRIDGCKDVARAPEPAPDARRQALAAECERMEVLNALGRSAQVAAEAPRLAEQARAEGALAAAATLQLSYGWALWNAEGPAEPAERALRQAVLDADASGQDGLSLRARVTLLNLLVVGQGRSEPGVPVAAEVRAWLARLGSPEFQEQYVIPALAALECALDHGAEGLRLYRRGLELSVKLYGADSTNAAGARNDLAAELARQGRHREALVEFRAAAESLDRARFAEPTTHALTWGNVAVASLDLGRIAEAEAALERALQIVAPIRESAASFVVWLDLLRALTALERGRPAEADPVFAAALTKRSEMDAPTLLIAALGHARALVALGRLAEAAPPAQEAVDLATTAADRLSRGVARFALAQALLPTERKRALSLGREALSDLDGPEDAYSREPVQAWLKAAGTPVR